MSNPTTWLASVTPPKPAATVDSKLLRGLLARSSPEARTIITKLDELARQVRSDREFVVECVLQARLHAIVSELDDTAIGRREAVERLKAHVLQVLVELGWDGPKVQYSLMQPAAVWCSALEHAVADAIECDRFVEPRSIPDGPSLAVTATLADLLRQPGARAISPTRIVTAGNAGWLSLPQPLSGRAPVIRSQVRNPGARGIDTREVTEADFRTARGIAAAMLWASVRPGGEAACLILSGGLADFVDGHRSGKIIAKLITELTGLPLQRARIDQAYKVAHALLIRAVETHAAQAAADAANEHHA